MRKTFTLDELISKLETEQETLPAINQFTENEGPSDQAIHNIIAYSRGLNVLKTKTAGNINVLVN